MKLTNHLEGALATQGYSSDLAPVIAFYSETLATYLGQGYMVDIREQFKNSEVSMSICMISPQGTRQYLAVQKKQTAGADFKVFATVVTVISADDSGWPDLSEVEVLKMFTTERW